MSITTGPLWDERIRKQIREKAQLGRTIIEGFGARRPVPSFDELTFLAAGLSRLCIDVHREECDTATILGARHAKRPLKLKTPIIIAPMSFGAVSREVKMAFARASTLAGTVSNTGEGGMLEEERQLARQLIYQCTPGRYGFNPRDLQRADAVELFISQGAKPGSGGHLMGAKITPEIAGQRGLPVGIDLRSPSRHPDFIGPDDLVLKILELREATGWQVPVALKIGASRVKEDVKIAHKIGADIVVLDGMQGGTGAGPEIFKDNVGIPTMAALAAAMQALREEGVEGEMDIVVMGGIRDGADVAKALALGAKAVGIGTAALVALGCRACRQCATGRCPAGLCTQDPALRQRFDPEEGAEKLANLIRAMTEELRMIARICGKTSCHNLEPEDLRALTVEASAITGIPLVGSELVFKPN
ncbi:MAG TPA: FMN-binding glutamate synthase family protein [Desulfotomaculum sp.]|nr:FMN-binding glutamate synthase family protein [Desulfotomaculum sp.]